MFDSFERQIEYLRISVTDRCNLRCRYCMPKEGICKKNHGDIVSYELIRKVVEAAIPLGISKIRLTGGEPLVRKGIVDLAASLGNLEGLKSLTMTTNGILLPLYAKGLKKAGLERINVSLDTLDPQKYRWLTRGGDVQAVLAGLDSLEDAGFSSTKINMVLIPGFNEDEVQPMKDFCMTRGLTLQRIHHYQLSDYRSIDFNVEAERPKACHLCNRIRMTADGMLKPCLFSDREFAIDQGNITESLKRAIGEKPRHGSASTQRENWQIGG